MLNIILGAVAVIIVAVLIMSYKKTGPDVAMLITGAGLGSKTTETNHDVNSRVKIVKGGGAFIIPVFQEARFLDLTTKQIDVVVPDTQTKSMVLVDIKATAILRVGSSKEMIAIAGEKIMGLSEEELQNQLSEMVKGQVRAIATEMEPAELVTDKQKFQAAVYSNVNEQLAQFGLEVTGFTITTITDRQNFFDNLAAPKLAAQERDAKNAQSEADLRVRETNAKNEQAAQEAEQLSQQNVSNFRKQTAIIAAQNEQQAKSAEAEANRIIAEKNGDVEIMKQQKAAQVAQEQVKISTQQYQADVVAKQRAEADAQRLQADAAAYTVEQEANAAAKSIRLNGQAEADAILAQGKAKAEAQEKLAAAFDKNSQQMLAQKIIEILPEIAAQIAEPLAAIDNMTVFNGANGVMDSEIQGLSQTMHFVKDATGVDLENVIAQRAAGTITAITDDSKPDTTKTTD